jgi:thiol-disulfide isomerase/thioredoxin
MKTAAMPGTLRPLAIAALATGLLLAAAPAAFASAGPAAAPAKSIPGWHAEVAKALDEAKQRDALILVDLYAEWCGWCKVLEDRVFTTPEFRAYSDRFVRLRVDTEDGAEGSRLQARFGITSLPTLLIIDHRRVKVGEVAGYMPTADFVDAIGAQLAAWELLLGHYDKVAKSDDLELQEQMAEEFHLRGDGGRSAGLYEKLRAKAAPASSDYAWYSFRLADAYRLERRFADAAKANALAQQAIAAHKDENELAEKIDLLPFYIAQDTGDCKGAVNSIERFLQAHPASGFEKQLRKKLDVLKSESTCT